MLPVLPMFNEVDSELVAARAEGVGLRGGFDGEDERGEQRRRKTCGSFHGSLSFRPWVKPAKPPSYYKQIHGRGT